MVKDKFIELKIPSKIIIWAKISLILGYIYMTLIFLGLVSEGIYSNLGIILSLIIGIGIAYLILKPLHWITKNSKSQR